MKNAWKLVLVNLVIVIADILCFSKAGLNLSFSSGDALMQAASYTVVLMSVFLFFYANIKILFPKKTKPDIHADMTLDGYAAELKKLAGKRAFAAPEFRAAVDQAEEFFRKKEALQRIIAFNNNKAMDVLLSTSNETEMYLEENFRQLIKRALVVDAKGEKVYASQYRPNILKLLEKNQEILNQFGVFLDEVSRMGDKVDLRHTDLLASIEALRQLRGAEAPTMEPIMPKKEMRPGV